MSVKVSAAQKKLIERCMVEGGVSTHTLNGSEWHTLRACIDRNWLRQDRQASPYKNVIRSTQAGLDAAGLPCPAFINEGDRVITPEGLYATVFLIDGTEANVSYDGADTTATALYDLCVLERAVKYDIGADVQLLPNGRHGTIIERDEDRLKIKWETGSTLWHHIKEVRILEWFEVTFEVRAAVRIPAHDAEHAHRTIIQNKFNALHDATKITRFEIDDVREL